MIFISGVHGVGKSYFCGLVNDRIGVKSYSASSLIADRKKQAFSADKLIPDIDDNQQYLLDAVAEIRAQGEEFILDGHFCLLNGEGVVARIGLNTFITLKPDAIILLTEDPTIITERRSTRDGIKHSAIDIKAFQDEEVAYATEVAQLLCVPIKISQGILDIESIIAFVSERRA